MAFRVELHVYDLTAGMAAQHSRSITGKQISGVWHTGVVVYGKEFYYGCGIGVDLAGCTPFGKLTKNDTAGIPTKRYELGISEMPEEIFMELLHDIAERFTP